MAQFDHAFFKSAIVAETVVLTTENDPRRVYVTGRGVQPKGLRTNEPAVFNCFTKDAGEGELTPSVLGPGGTQVPCSKQPKADGEFECVYRPMIAGPYKVKKFPLERKRFSLN